MEPEELDEAFRQRVAMLDELRRLNANVERLIELTGMMDERLAALEKATPAAGNHRG